MYCEIWLRQQWAKSEKSIYGREVPPPIRSAAHEMLVNQGMHTCLWLKEWQKLTVNDKKLQFPENGMFDVKKLENLSRVMFETTAETCAVRSTE